MLFFYIEHTGALGPRDFCKQYKQHVPGSSSSAPIDLDPEIGPSNMTNSYYYVDPEQPSTFTYTPDETPMFKFILTKEEEEEVEKKSKGNKKMRRI